MKILVIPDIHGNWKDALKNIKDHKDEVDKVVILGDYVDDFDEALNGQNMIDGFNQLCEMARKEPEKFNILLGNHDLSYLPQSRHAEQVSGHHSMYAKDYWNMFTKNLDILNIACELDGVLFSHAGISKNWYSHASSMFNTNHELDKVPNNIWDEYSDLNNRSKDIKKYYFNDEVFSLVNIENEEHQAKVDKYYEIQAQIYKKMNELYSFMLENYRKDTISNRCTAKNINKIFHYKNHNGDNFTTSNFEHSGWDSSGNSSGETCTWIRPEALLEDDWPKCKMQVVGHTETKERCYKFKNKKLMILDSQDHNLWKIIDTEKLDEITFEEYKPTAKFAAEEIKLMQLMGLI